MALPPARERGGNERWDGPAVSAHDRTTRRVRLTERELEVLTCLAAGLPNKAIAAELGISLGTVKFHIANLMSKLGAQNRAELVMEAAREGYLEV